jgi:hypothetical protein
LLSFFLYGREVPGESMLSAETGLEAFEKPFCSSSSYRVASTGLKKRIADDALWYAANLLN